MRRNTLKRFLPTCRRRVRNRISALLAAALWACHSAPQTLKPTEVAQISPAQGAVSAKLVPDPDSPDVKLAPGEEYVPPQLMPGNPKPQYPPDLVKRNLSPHVVSVRATFGENSKLLDLRQSPVAATTHDDYTPAFEAAVRDSLEKWICYPARIRTFRQGSGDFRILSSQRLLKTYFDLSFTFEIENGQPVVKSAQ